MVRTKGRLVKRWEMRLDMKKTKGNLANRGKKSTNMVRTSRFANRYFPW